jgi:glycosyltransferase involved in cell wall biosynthesis
MRILFLHPFGWSGEYPLLVEFRRHGHDVCVLEERREGMVGARMFSDHFVAPEDAIRTMWYHPGRGFERLVTFAADRYFRRTFDGRNLVHRMWVIREAVRHFQPDLVYCTDGFSYAVPAALLKHCGLLHVPLVASYIGGDILDCAHLGYGLKRTPALDRLMRTAIRNIDALRPLCDSLERALLKDGADPTRITQIPIQIGAPREIYEDVFSKRENTRQNIRTRLGIPQDAPVVMTLASNHFSKGVQELARAWPKLAASIPGIWWILAGPETKWLAEGVMPLLEASGARDRVHLIGRTSARETYEYLSAADLNVNPTLCEGLNMVTVDAATVGTPTVSSDAAGVSAWILRHECGLVFPAGDIPALEDAVICALSDTKRLLAWDTRCRKMISDFTAESVYRRMEALFAATAKAPNKPG